MDNPPLQQRLETTLRKLPNGYRAIARYLEAEGIKGVPENACSCPVARWVRRDMEIPYVAVTGSVVMVRDETDLAAMVIGRHHIRRFVSEFDGGTFPGLVDSEGPTLEERFGLDSDELEPL